jgi:hypothetical protein
MKSFLHVFIYFFIPIALVGFVFWYGWGENLKKGSQSLELKEKILFKTGSLDLGSFRKVSPVFKKDFNLFQREGGQIYLSKVYSDCDCLSVLLLPNTLRIGPFSMIKEEYGRPVGEVGDKGENLSFQILFDPSLVEGNVFNGSVYFETGDKDDVLRLNFKAKIF